MDALFEELGCVVCDARWIFKAKCTDMRIYVEVKMHKHNLTLVTSSLSVHSFSSEVFYGKED